MLSTGSYRTNGVRVTELALIVREKNVSVMFVVGRRANMKFLFRLGGSGLKNNRIVGGFSDLTLFITSLIFIFSSNASALLLRLIPGFCGSRDFVGGNYFMLYVHRDFIG